MQTTEIVGQVQPGHRLPPAEADLPAERAKPEPRAERASAEASRRPATRTSARPPRHYGAGF
jgi:hypothetical protein